MNSQTKVYLLVRVMEYGSHGVSVHPVGVFDTAELAEEERKALSHRLKEFAEGTVRSATSGNLGNVAGGLGTVLGISRVQFNIMETPLFTANKVLLVSEPNLRLVDGPIIKN